MVPDRLPQELKDPIRLFPRGALQFEIGIQTLNQEVARLIRRPQDQIQIQENIRYLRENTGVHIHADLIAGLPGEDMASFASGFDRLVGWNPQEIQVGLLKRLRGAPISRHDETWEMVYHPHPPYEVLKTKLLDFPSLQRIRRFARYWDIVVNSGRFLTTAPLMWYNESPFRAFMAFPDRLFENLGRTHGITPDTVAEQLLRYLVDERSCDRHTVLEALQNDDGRAHRPDGPRPLHQVPSRQARHGRFALPTSGKT
jgi:hypothetical protein